MKTRLAMFPVIVLLVLGLTACSTNDTVMTSVPETPSDTSKKSLESCDVILPAHDWIRTFVLPPSSREESLNTVKTPDTYQQIWLRAILLTHNEASYRELREAENLLLKQLKLSITESTACIPKELLNYILKLNRILQKQKSEVVLLQHQLNEQIKTIEAQIGENEELHKKIEALTNIEHRMKQRAKKVKPEASLYNGNEAR